MKLNSLRFGKAMSAALFVLLLSVVGMKNALAQTQVATLQHGEDISVFYGTNAFVEAHTAAADGDIVTLSGGSYTAPTTITKAITLRGTGVATDTVAGITPTIFTGVVKFNVTNDSVACNVEGILFNGGIRYGDMINPKFTKCNITNFNSDGTMSNAQFVNCKINRFYSTRAINTTFINSVVGECSGPDEGHTVSFYNSIICGAYHSSGGPDGVSAYNSVVGRSSNSSSHYSFGSNSTFFNCIGIKLGTYNPFGSGYTSGCTTYNSYASVFETFTGTFDLEEPFILTDEIATGFLGNDGTQVGIYGGFMPYSNRPSYMVMKRCNVANKSTIDGKLSVDIEVVTEEE